MPLYEYKCDACGSVFEVIQKFADDPLSAHAGCGGRVERLISSPAFHFKGTGWYVTDYARKPAGGNGSNTAKPAETAAKTEGKTESKAETKPESKPAAKTELKK
ncbi:MAG: zinc ribbon domain-containing protein [Acidobacteria bacterium]|nr:zinc ribbon domain-containing protein [Acidobacteriota bacterium]